jgi:hypothetical protein
VDRGQAGDLGGQQRVLLGVAEALGQLVEGAGRARGVEPDGASGSSPGVVHTGNGAKVAS